MTMRAMVLREHGGPEVLHFEDVAMPEPGPGEVRVRVRAVSVNHLDIWVRKDNLIPLKWVMFDKSSGAAKTLLTKELQRHDGRWQITRSAMTDASTGRTTEVLIEHMEPQAVTAETFSANNLAR